MEFSIYTSDIKDLNEELDRKFDVRDEYGLLIFRGDGRLEPQDEYLKKGGYYVTPTSYVGIMMDLQEQLLRLNEQVRTLEFYVSELQGKTDA